MDFTVIWKGLEVVIMRQAVSNLLVNITSGMGRENGTDNCDISNKNRSRIVLSYCEGSNAGYWKKAGNWLLFQANEFSMFYLMGQMTSKKTTKYDHKLSWFMSNKRNRRRQELTEQLLR